MRTAYFDVESDSSDEEDYVIKVFVIGASRVGKTTFINRLVRNRVSLNYIPTHTLEIYNPVKIGIRSYQLFDVPQHVSTNHYTPHAVVLMCTDLTSLHEACKIYKEQNLLAETWVVVQDLGQLWNTSSIQVCPQARIFKVNNLSAEGVGNLIFSIQQTF